MVETSPHCESSTVTPSESACGMPVSSSPISEPPLTSSFHGPKPHRTRESTKHLKRRRGDSILFPSPPRSTPPTPERPTKRPKTRHDEEQDSPQGRTHRFWDNLTYIPLVKSALAEADRRNNDIGARNPTPVAKTDVSLLRFARQGGPDLSDLRGFGRMPPKGRGVIQKPRARGRGARGSRSGSHGTSQASKNSSPYDRAFKQHLIDHNIWPIGHYLQSGDEPPAPDNLQDILRVLDDGGRASLEPEAFNDEAFRQFRKAYNIASAEEPQSRTLDTIEGATLALSSLHSKRGPIKLTNLLPLLPENLVPGNPDRAYGARPENLMRSVRDDLEHLILPTTAKDIVCPNFIVHIKGPAGDLEVAKLQAVYDGSLAARGMDALWAYGSDANGDAEEDGDEQEHVARTITCTFADGVLRLYAVHSRRRHSRRLSRASVLQQVQQQTHSWSRSVEYVTTQLGCSWPMLDNLQAFRAGAAAFRNGLECARRQRDEAINRANRRAKAEAGSAGLSFSSDSTVTQSRVPDQRDAYIASPGSSGSRLHLTAT